MAQVGCHELLCTRPVTRGVCGWLKPPQRRASTTWKARCTFTMSIWSRMCCHARATSHGDFCGDQSMRCGSARCACPRHPLCDRYGYTPITQLQRPAVAAVTQGVDDHPAGTKKEEERNSLRHLRHGTSSQNEGVPAMPQEYLNSQQPYGSSRWATRHAT